MKKLWKFACLCVVLYLVFWCGILYADRIVLNENLIRLHIVANSDTEEDQTLKLMIRDTVIQQLQESMMDISSLDEAKQCLQEQLPELETLVNQVLADQGSTDTAKVTLAQEAFDTRHYDTFSLPAGYYEALRITIGSGEGKNWWCVVFPSLCLPATSEEFADAAVGSGFSDGLTQTLQQGEHEIRFFLLDCFGRIENFFRSL